MSLTSFQNIIIQIILNKNKSQSSGNLMHPTLTFLIRCHTVIRQKDGGNMDNG